MLPTIGLGNRFNLGSQWDKLLARARNCPSLPTVDNCVRADGSTHEGSERLAGMEDVFPYELRKAVPGCVTLRKMVFVQEAPDGAAASG